MEQRLRYYRCAVCGKTITGISSAAEWGYGYGSLVACSWSHQRELERAYAEKDRAKVLKPEKQRVRNKKYYASVENKAQILELRHQGLTAPQIAVAVRLSPTTVYRVCAEAGVPFGLQLPEAPRGGDVDA